MVNVSVVLYKNSLEEIERLIDCLLPVKNIKNIFLINNSPKEFDVDFSKTKKKSSKIIYILNPVNSGYGAANNIAIKRSLDDGLLYHLVLNPDVFFDFGLIDELFNYMNLNQDVGMIRPKVLNTDSSIQNNARLLPSPLDLISRRLGYNFHTKLENAISNSKKELNIPFLSGCFMFLRVSIIEKVGMFDENIFLYMEDLDLSRRINAESKTLHYPFNNIFHEEQLKSRFNIMHFVMHLKSAIYYFNKWGWYKDKLREELNQKALKGILESCE